MELPVRFALFSALLLSSSFTSQSVQADENVVLHFAKDGAASRLSGAEVDERTEQALTIHRAWLRELADHPENKTLEKASRRNPYPHHPEKMRCWISNVAVFIGASSGICRSANRTYAFSALFFGLSETIHTSRVRLVADRPFPDAGFQASGGHSSAHIFIGFDGYTLSGTNPEINVEGRGIGVGLGFSVDAVWVVLTRVE